MDRSKGYMAMALIEAKIDLFSHHILRSKTRILTLIKVFSHAFVSQISSKAVKISEVKTR